MLKNIPPIRSEFESILKKKTPDRPTLTSICREVFYECSKDAFAVVAKSESAIFANIILKKWVVII